MDFYAESNLVSWLSSKFSVFRGIMPIIFPNKRSQSRQLAIIIHLFMRQTFLKILFTSVLTLTKNVVQ